MGLLDILNGMQNGPRGPNDAEAKSEGGGMSPITMAILALLAYKTVKHIGGGSAQSDAGQARTSLPGSSGTDETINASLPGGLGDLFKGLGGGGASAGTGGGVADLLKGLTGGSAGGAGGGIGDLLKGGLGGLLAGGAAGSILSGGIGDLLKQFQENGQSEVADSWVSPGANKQIESGDLAKALGADQINLLTAQTGLSREDLLSGLSQRLPDVINQLTPDGRIPTEHEASRWI